MRNSKTLKIAIAAFAAVLFVAQPASAAVNLTGAGATFPIPLLDACKAGFASATGNSYTYTGGGSGAGRTASDKGIGDFNFSDTPHTASSKLPSVIHIPVVAAPIAVMYNLNIKKVLNLSPFNCCRYLRWAKSQCGMTQQFLLTTIVQFRPLPTRKIRTVTSLRMLRASQLLQALAQ
ncbi:MAG: substrate-binding domain-containing protein [Actinomycetota bacterium]